jgi:hypothetical protein
MRKFAVNPPSIIISLTNIEEQIHIVPANEIPEKGVLMLYRKPLFWIVLILLVILSCLFIIRYGNRVFFFDLQITMNAKTAKTAAENLANPNQCR